ncbi:unnamed protein product [Closterium sp. Yama58-4]|nr:unnamed protein product [Closterium sp. Yama58-4]
MWKGGALEHFNSHGHIPPEALKQIWVAWQASGDTWHTHRDSVQLIVFNAAVQLALDECIGSPRLPASSGPSFLAAMAAAVGLSPSVALAAILNQVAARLETELIACNDLIEAFMWRHANVKLRQIANLLSAFTPPAISHELVSSAHRLGVMLTQRQRQELAWMYERAAGTKHVVLMRTALGHSILSNFIKGYG